MVAADGLGDAVALVLPVEGLGLGDGDPLVLLAEGLGLGELLWVPEGDGLGDPDVVAQLRVGDGSRVGELLTPPWLEELAVLLEAACLPPPPPPPGPYWPLFLV